MKNEINISSSGGGLKIIKSNLNRAIPVKSISNKHKLIRNPSKEFLNLKETIEKQLKMPRFTNSLVIKQSSHNTMTTSIVHQLDSLGSSAITTDQSANMSLTSFSSSLITLLHITNIITLSSIYYFFHSLIFMLLQDGIRTQDV